MTVTTINEENAKLLKEHSAPKKCQWCGKPFVPVEVSLFGQKKIVYAVDCNCYEVKQAEKEAAKRKENLQSKFKIANIGRRYENITLELLEKLGTENVAEAKRYIKYFNPNNGNSIHMIGEFGNGKTSLGYAIIKKLLTRYNCTTLTWNDFITRCHYAQSFNSEETVAQLVHWLSSFDLVMLDEFVVNIKDEKEINLATTLFDNFYKDNKCFILINNPCDITDMQKIPRLGKLLDRVRQQAVKFVFKHSSYRRSENA